MTMVPSLRSPAGGRTRVAAAVWMIVVLLASVSFAEEPPVHFWHADAMPPGAIGQGQLTRGGPLPGYFQPVEILAPQGARVSMAEPGRFQKPMPAPLGVGLLIGQVYRLKVTNIPGYEGAEVYPTIEIIDRLYPPVGQEMRFPIPIDLSQEEIELAVSGRFVMRVVYLEDPNDALPIDELPDEQTVFQALPGENPLTVADRLGRPMAILRIGGRVPDADGPDEAFLYGSPPWLKFQPVPVERPALKPPAPLARTPGNSQGHAARACAAAGHADSAALRVASQLHHRPVVEPRSHANQLQPASRRRLVVFSIGCRCPHRCLAVLVSLLLCSCRTLQPAVPGGLAAPEVSSVAFAADSDKATDEANPFGDDAASDDATMDDAATADEAEMSDTEAPAADAAMPDEAEPSEAPAKGPRGR